MLSTRTRGVQGRIFPSIQYTYCSFEINHVNWIKVNLQGGVFCYFTWEINNSLKKIHLYELGWYVIKSREAWRASQKIWSCNNQVHILMNFLTLLFITNIYVWEWQLFRIINITDLTKLKLISLWESDIDYFRFSYWPTAIYSSFSVPTIHFIIINKYNNSSFLYTECLWI